MSVSRLIVHALFLIPSLAFAATTVAVDAAKERFPTAPDLWGIFFEDIDLSLDGGVYAGGHGDSK